MGVTNQNFVITSRRIVSKAPAKSPAKEPAKPRPETSPRMHTDCMAYLGAMHTRHGALNVIHNRPANRLHFLNDLRVYLDYLSDEIVAKKNKIPDSFLDSIKNSIHLNELMIKNGLDKNHSAIKWHFSKLIENNPNSFLLVYQNENGHAYGKVFRKINKKIHEVCINRGRGHRSYGMYAYLDHRTPKTTYLDTKISTPKINMYNQRHRQTIGNCANLVARMLIEFVLATRDGDPVKARTYKTKKKILTPDGVWQRIHQAAWQTKAHKDNNETLKTIMAWVVECKKIRGEWRKSDFNPKTFTLKNYPLVRHFGIDLKTYIRFNNKRLRKGTEFIKKFGNLLPVPKENMTQADFLAAVEKKWETKWHPNDWNGESYMAYFFRRKLDDAYKKVGRKRRGQLNPVQAIHSCLASKHQEIKKGAARAMVSKLKKQFGSQTPIGEKDINILVMYLNSKHPRIQKYAAHRLIKCLESNDPATLEYASETFVTASYDLQKNKNLFGARTIQALVKLLDSSNPETQENALLALINALYKNRSTQKCLEKKGLDALRRCLRSKHAEVHENAALALWNALYFNDSNYLLLGTEGVLELRTSLGKCLKSENQDVRDYAIESITELKNKTLDVKIVFSMLSKILLGSIRLLGMGDQVAPSVDYFAKTIGQQTTNQALTF